MNREPNLAFKRVITQLHWIARIDDSRRSDIVIPLHTFQRVNDRNVHNYEALPGEVIFVFKENEDGSFRFRSYINNTQVAQRVTERGPFYLYYINQENTRLDSSAVICTIRLENYEMHYYLDFIRIMRAITYDQTSTLIDKNIYTLQFTEQEEEDQPIEPESIDLQDKTVNIENNGVLVVQPDTEDGYEGLSSVIVNTNVPTEYDVEVTKTVSINQNGNYTYSATEPYDVIKDINVNVNVPTSSNVNVETIKQKTVFTNTTTEIVPSQGYDAMEKVVVATLVDNKTTTKTITENGTYYAYQEEYVDPDQRFDRYIGYSSVTVDVPERLIERMKSAIFDQNGTYIIEPSSQEYSGIAAAQVSVNVPQTSVNNANVTQNNNITANGIFTIPNGYTGFNSFSVNVPSATVYEYDRQLQFILNNDQYPSTSNDISRTVTASVPSNYTAQRAVSYTADLLYKSITSNGIYEIKNDRSNNYEIGYWKINVNVPQNASPNLQSKQVNIVTNNYSEIIRPDQGYDGISDVTLVVSIPSLTSPLQVYTLEPVTGDYVHRHDFLQNMFTQGDGSFVYLQPGEAIAVWYLREGHNPSFSIYYYKGTGTQWPVGNGQMNSYRWYKKFTPDSNHPIDIGTNLSLLDGNNVESFTLAYKENYFPNNVPGLLSSYIAFPISKIGSQIKLRNWMENILIPPS